MRAGSSAFVEIFEWESVGAIDEEHSNPTVRAICDRLAQVCEYESLTNLPEFQRPFSPFTVTDL